MPFVFIGIVLAVIIIAGIAGRIASERRRKELAAWAAERALSYDRADDDSLEDAYPEFSQLRQGSNRYAYNIMAGTAKERAVVAFDYHYETHSTDSKGRRSTHHHYFSAVIVGSPVPLRPLSIRPEGFFDRVGEFFGFDDIDFESAEFSRAFFVKAPDRKWAYDVLHQRAMEFMLSMPRFTVQFGALHVLICRDSTFKTTDFDAALALANGLLDRLPEFLVRQQLGQG